MQEFLQWIRSEGSSEGRNDEEAETDRDNDRESEEFMGDHSDQQAHAMLPYRSEVLPQIDSGIQRGNFLFVAVKLQRGLFSGEESTSYDAF